MTGKYDKYVQKLKFDNDGPGYYRQVATLDGATMELDAHIQYGVYHAAGDMVTDSPGTHVHDYDQVMLFYGADAADMGELGAEIELRLGEKGEKYMITTSTAVAVPRGMPHFPANIQTMDKRFVFVKISGSPTYKEIPYEIDKETLDSAPYAGFMSGLRNHVIPMAFQRKGPWGYGEKNRDDSGGSLAFIRGNDVGFEFLVMLESIKKAPYRFGPEPDKPHAHPQPEILFFLGTDLDDASRLNGEAEIYLGKEMVKYTITEPTAVVVPAGLAHCPLVMTKVEKPFLLMDVRPFGSGPMNAGKL
ncbi:MAG: hypothetical protein MUO19_01285 [Dehalococcoidales bacterium]|nr:hypothetical protein [Dehalococcoidales bacterium]